MGGGPHLLREKGFEPGGVEREPRVLFGGQRGEGGHALPALLLPVQSEGEGGRGEENTSAPSFLGKVLAGACYAMLLRSMRAGLT